MTMRQLATRRRGQAAVELALALPLLLLVVFGLLGAGRLTATIVSVSAVAREAARAGRLEQARPMPRCAPSCGAKPWPPPMGCVLPT